MHVEIPADVLGDGAGGSAPSGADHRRVGSGPPRGARAGGGGAAAARRPLILAGDGVLHAGATEALGELAHGSCGRRWSPRCWGRARCRRTTPGRWETATRGRLRGLRPEHDLLLAVGARFVQVDTRWPWFFAPRRLVHLDADAREVGRVYPAEVGLAGRSGRGAGAAAPALERAPGDRSGWDERFPGR